ncbi:MAG: GFA family protein [Hyphomicrobium sp.]
MPPTRRFHQQDVTFKGETRSYAVTADSGNTITRHFCPTCGSRLYIESSARPGFPQHARRQL